MKTLKYLTMCLTVCCLFTASVFAQPDNVGIGISIRAEFQGTNDLAFVASPGDVIEYIVTINLTASQFPITDGEPSLTLPNGTVIDLDDNLALATDTSIVYPPQAYTVNVADLGNQPGAAANEVRALAAVEATSQTGETTQDVTATTNFDTVVIEPDFMVTKECVNPDGTLVGEDAIFLIIITNTGDVPLTFYDTGTELDAYEPIVLPPASDAPANVFQANVAVPTDGECADDLLVSNTVEVSGFLDGETVAFDTKSDTADCPVLCPPSFSVEKICLTDPITDEPNALFQITITNTGWIPLDFEIDDEAAGIVDLLVEDIAPDANYVIIVEVPADCVNGAVSNRVVVQAYFDGEPVLDPMPAEAECPCASLEGCTPGFWKNHPDCWDCYDTETLLGEVFDIPSELGQLGNKTLLEAMDFTGGATVKQKSKILLRVAVASLLNACDPDVDYPLDVDEVINQVNAALASLHKGTIIDLKNTLDMYNNLGCPIDAHCNPKVDDEVVNGF